MLLKHYLRRHARATFYSHLGLMQQCVFFHALIVLQNKMWYGVTANCSRIEKLQLWPMSEESAY